MDINQLINIALKYQDYPSIRYKGPSYGMNIDGFDCSGYICFILNQCNFDIHNLRHCNELFDRFGSFVHYDCHKKGDLVFFSRHGTFPTHVGIMLSKAEYIHAPGENNTNIEITHLQQQIIIPKKGYQEQIIYNLNPIGFKRIGIINGRYNKFIE